MSKKKNAANLSELGADIKEARVAMGLSRRALAEEVNIDPRYLANIENSGSIPSLPVFYDLVTILNLPVMKYFYPQQTEPESERRKRTSLKLRLCPEKYLTIVESTLDGVLKMGEMEDAE